MKLEKWAEIHVHRNAMYDFNLIHFMKYNFTCQFL